MDHLAKPIKIFAFSLYFCLISFFSQAQVPTGDLDLAFGLNGKASIDLVPSMIETYYKLIHQPDGKILICGAAYTFDGPGDSIVARFDQDGNLDPSFGDGGVVRLNVAALMNGLDPETFPFDDRAKAMALQTFGNQTKIIVVGYGWNALNKIYAMRLNMDGTVDTSFGTNGFTKIDASYDNDYPNAVAIYNEGSANYSNYIVIGGKAYDTYHTGIGDIHYDYLTARLDADGHLDTAFNSGGNWPGTVAVDIAGSDDEVLDIDVRNNGQVYVGGYYQVRSVTPNVTDIAIIKYKKDGTPRLDFGINGQVIGGFARDLPWPDCRIHAIDFKSNQVYVAGFDRYNGELDYFIARYSDLGVLDNGFNGTGVVINDYGQIWDKAVAMTFLDNGEILIGGNSQSNPMGVIGDIGLALHKTDGSLQTDFNSVGYLWHDLLQEANVMDISLDGGNRAVVLMSDSVYGSSLYRFFVTNDVDEDGDGVTIADGDCDDTNPNMYPGATESCDGVDNDCDGAVDEPGSQGESTWYFDNDWDGYGNDLISVQACDQPHQHVNIGGDCNDNNAVIHPGADEYCNGIDLDCDGFVDQDDSVDATTWYLDDDGDSYGNPSISQVKCDAPPKYVEDDTDCDDTNDAIHPGAQESCDDIDNDCDGQTDEGQDAVGAQAWYADADGDGYGNKNSEQLACDQPGGYVSDFSDCDDTKSEVNPNGAEICGDGIDQDCSGDDEPCPDTGDEDQDGDGPDDTGDGSKDAGQPDSGDDTQTGTDQGQDKDQDVTTGASDDGGSGGCAITGTISYQKSQIVYALILLGLALLGWVRFRTRHMRPEI